MEINSLKYAYIGDAVFELFIRQYLVKNKNVKIEDIHKECTKIVCAHTQSNMISKLIDLDLLTENEIDIYKKARNTKTHSKSKNSNISEYHKATGFECLIGYLHINDKNREKKILEKILQILKEEELL